MKSGVLGVVLAGGRSARFGGDKALAMLAGKTLLERVCERTRPQVAILLINRSGQAQCSVPQGYTSLADEHPNQGPLAGVLAALKHAEGHGYTRVATFPCDTPFLPDDTVSRMCARAGDAELCIAQRGDEEHFVVSLWSIDCRLTLERAFDGGVRSIWAAATKLNMVGVNFPIEGEGPGGNAFFNINTLDDLAIADTWVRNRSSQSEIDFIPVMEAAKSPSDLWSRSSVRRVNGRRAPK